MLWIKKPEYRDYGKHLFRIALIHFLIYFLILTYFLILIYFLILTFIEIRTKITMETNFRIEYYMNSIPICTLYSVYNFYTLLRYKI
jgi:hypothetical protein